MLFITILLLGVGLLVAVLSVLPRHAIPDFTLPEREARRAWLPIGLIFITLSGLFGVMYTTTLPSSPLRQAETADQLTSRAYQTNQMRTYDVHQQLLLTTTATPSNFELTATVIVRNATVTAQATLTGAPPSTP